jgi:hypothetical protein
VGPLPSAVTAMQHIAAAQQDITGPSHPATAAVSAVGSSAASSSGGAHGGPKFIAPDFSQLGALSRSAANARIHHQGSVAAASTSAAAASSVPAGGGGVGNLKAARGGVSHVPSAAAVGVVK